MIYHDLTEPQKFIWLANNMSDKMNPSVTFDVLFDGGLNLPAACGAVDCLYMHNQILRTEVTDFDGIPKQIFKKYNPDEKHSILKTFSGLSLYKIWAEEYALQKMDGVLSEIFIIDIDTKYGFLIKGSHMVLDGLSCVLLMSRLMKYYELLVSGNSIDDIEYHYLDFIKREQLYYKDSYGYLQDRGYWQKKILEIDEPTWLTTVKTGSILSNRLELPLPSDFENKLKIFCKAYKVSEYAVILSCFAKCASAYLKNDNITILCTVLNRIGVMENQIPGMFVNLVPVALDCGNKADSQVSAINYIKTTQIEFVNAVKHFRYSYNHILNDFYKLRGRRQPSDILFSYQSFELYDIQSNLNGTFTPTWYFNGTQTNSLTFHARRDPKSGLKFFFEYLAEIFSENDVNILGAHVLEMLNSLFANPEALMSGLSIMGKEEREKILLEFNNTYAAYPTEKTVIELFEGQAEKAPENIAVILGNQRITYRELNERANSVARNLIDASLKPGEFVAICAERSIEILQSNWVK